jgi:NADH-quinone oxidoreductase subunit A
MERYAGFGLVEMGVFVAILVLGLVYAWRKRVLRWV